MRAESLQPEVLAPLWALLGKGPQICALPRHFTRQKSLVCSNVVEKSFLGLQEWYSERVGVTPEHGARNKLVSP